MTRAICSKLWTDIQIRMPNSRINNCCKSWQWEKYTPLQIKEMGNAFFNDRPELVYDKNYMVNNDKLPPRCGECAAQFPGGYFGGHNEWLHKTWSDQDYKMLSNDLTKYIEIMYSTTCNMACMYCNESVSSLWADLLNVPKQELNSKWRDAVFEELYKYIPTLNTQMLFNFTGGEPLLEPKVFELIETIARLANKNYKHRFMITSNMNIKPRLVEKFLQIVENYSQFDWCIAVSVDEVGPSLLRHGLDWDLWEKNVDTLLQSNLFYFISFTPSITNLSLPNHHLLVEYLQSKKTSSNVDIGNNMVYGPQELSFTIAPKSFVQYIEKAIDATIIPQHKQFLEKCRVNVGIQRSVETIEKAKLFFTKQSQVKGVDYLAAYPHLEKILDIAIE